MKNDPEWKRSVSLYTSKDILLHNIYNAILL